MADPYEILWDSRYRSKVGVLDEYRETIGMVLLKNGITNLNTARPKHLELVHRDLRDLASATQPVIDVNAYQDLPTGKTWVSMAFSGDLVAAPEYLPEGLDAEVLRYWFPLDGRGTVGNDLMTVLRSSRNPVLAHHFLDFLLDFDMAMLNQPGVERIPAAAGSDRPHPAGQAGLHPSQPDDRGGQAGVLRDRLSRGGAGPRERQVLACGVVRVQGQAVTAAVARAQPRHGWAPGSRARRRNPCDDRGGAATARGVAASR